MILVQGKAALPAWSNNKGLYTAHQTNGAVHLEDRKSQTLVTVNPRMGNIAFEMKVRGTNALQSPGIPFLAPWANRLDEQAFYANGKRYPFHMDLGNVRGAAPIHGFLSQTDHWHVVEVGADEASAWVTGTLEFWKQPAWMKQWPFAHTIEMTHRLQNGVLQIETKITNQGAEPMPVSVGFHPYFTLADSPRDEWILSLPVKTRWLLSASKIPTGETEPADKLFPDPHAVLLKDYTLDDVFSDLVRDSLGRAHFIVKGRQQQLDVVLGPNWRGATVWSADSNSICIEPMAGISNGLNLAHKGLYKEQQYVGPGAVWSESFWITPSGF